MNDVLTGFKNHDRGKMIMACGTGKTLTSLHIAEKQVGKGGIVLYVVPSISLILQSMREWSDNANIRHNYMAVCSDKSTGEDGSITELESPVSTYYKTLKPYIENKPKDAMTVIFSTYHSIDVVRKAMNNIGFDIIFCDEAHRTTGVEDKSFFTVIHDNKNIQGKKRLYMTATPRIYSDVIKAKMGRSIYSMDNEKDYGPNFHILNFTDAVSQNILSDFRVKIAIVPADKVDKEFQQSIADADKSIPLDERTLYAAIWHGLKYPDDEKNPKLLQRVIAFANRIDRSMMFAGKITDNNNVDRIFANVVELYEKKYKTGLKVQVDHIDGKTKALDRRDSMRWLDESNVDLDTCRIVSNAKCLAEGVDVPSLDGVIFLNPRKSRVDVVQSVGRVMRKSKGKDYGYVILPVAIPAGLKYHEALDDNKTFKIVWEVLNALRSHDENFGAEINKLILDRNTENTHPTDRISISVLDSDFTEKEIITKFFDKVKSKLVEKVGDIDYYDKYGQKLGNVSRTIEQRLKNKIKSDIKTELEIQKFHESLKKMINNSVTQNATIQAISQHLVLSRVFDEMFSGEFASHNPISLAFNRIIKKIGFNEELEELEDFYKDVKRETKEIDTPKTRQNFIKKIYGNFFESADKKGSKQHGVVYTPVEVIDFIIHSTQHILQKEFSTGFNDRSVKVLDPFTGTGTFLVRLLESGYITTNLYEKYKHDMYANELILLAYYIATVNIETAYSAIRKSGKYIPFAGISYTDTLRINPLYRDDKRHRQTDSTLTDDFKIAHTQIKKQRSSHVHVIIGNPPYSAGQSDYNDQNQNISYLELDARIKVTYIEKARVSNTVSLYDSYIRSLRWASDRIGDSGIIAFVTNASFIKSNVGSGVRACLEKEFTDVWCFDLRGNAYTHGEKRKQESGNVFGSGSRAPVSITILVKNPIKKKCTIHYKDIGDYLTREQKLKKIQNAKFIDGIKNWHIIEPDNHNDWLKQRSIEFLQYTPMGNHETKSGAQTTAIFRIYSRGIVTSRDAWSYNSSERVLSENMKRHINYCNEQDLSDPVFDPLKAKWTAELFGRLKKSGKQVFDNNKIRDAVYRPFFKQYLYFDKIFNTAQYVIPKIFPKKNSDNLTIIVPYRYNGEPSVFMTNTTPDLGIVQATQCFSLYIYNNGQKQDNITDFALNQYQNYYNDEGITKEAIFYYVYGLLHHESYKKKYANNLSRELPNIPMAPKFKKFSKAGKKLAELHLNYETCPQYNLKQKIKFGKLEKMAFSKKEKNGKKVNDKTRFMINGIEIFENIPETSYTVNGRTPLECLIDRYKFTTDKDSRITNDPTKDMTEKKTISLIKRLVYVSVESDKIIKEISKEAFEPKNWTPEKTGLDRFSEKSNSR